MRMSNLLLISLLIPGIAFASDLIQLKNGSVFEGRIIAQDKKTLRLRIATKNMDNESTIEMDFQQDNIVNRIIDTSRLKSTAAKKIKLGKKNKKTDKKNSRTKKSSDKSGNKDEAPEDEEHPEDPMVNKYIKKLITEDEKIFNMAIGKLKGFGKERSSYWLVMALKKGTAEQKKGACIALGRLLDKRATQALIDTLFLPLSQSSITEEAWIALKKITGRSFPYRNKGVNTRRTKHAKRWKNWFAGVKDREEYANQLKEEKPEAQGDEKTKAKGK